MPNRLNIISYFIGILFLIITIKLFDLQVVQGNKLLRASEQNRTRINFESAPRGNIFDRNMHCLADSVSSYVVYFSPEDMNEEEINKTLDNFSQLLNVKVNKHRIIKSKGSRPAVIRLVDSITREEMFWLEENRYNLPGVSLGVEFKRRYTYEKIASHLIGYLGELSKTELNSPQYASCRVGSFVGKSGIERIYDPYIRGEDGGMQIEVDARGNQLRVIRRILSTPGNDVLLFLDIGLQKILEEAFSKQRGAAIVMDPRSGEVLAMLSSPDFDLNWFVDISTNVVQRNMLLSDPKLPMFNRALQGRYAPGSVFKIITSAAALEEQKVDIRRTVYCNGQFLIGKEGRVFKCWKPKGHGRVDFVRAFTESCDVYFYQLGLKCGVDLIEKYARRFGIDRYSEIDLPGEALGFMPDRVWKKRRFRDVWYDGDTVNIAIGQGYVLTTPLNMACLSCILANKGILYQPRVVNVIRDQQREIVWQSSKRKIFDVNLKQETWDLLTTVLQKVVVEGTGVAANVYGVSIAGKTGTAQNPHGGDHAWFICYAPVENPEVAMAIFVEHGGHGGSVAAPIAQQVIQEMLVQRKKITKEEDNIKIKPQLINKTTAAVIKNVDSWPYLGLKYGLSDKCDIQVSADQGRQLHQYCSGRACSACIFQIPIQELKYATGQNSSPTYFVGDKLPRYNLDIGCPDEFGVGLLLMAKLLIISNI